MDRCHRRCGLVAAAGAMALLANKVADVQGFAFTSPLQQRGASRLTLSADGRRAEVCARSGRRSAHIADSSWTSRRTRTALRMASEESSSLSGGGAAAAEAIPIPIPPDVGGEKAEPEEVFGKTAQSEKLRLTAEKLKLQAEKLRLEVEKEQLLLQSEKLQEKEALEGKQDALIAKLRVLKGRDEELTAFVKQEIKKINAELFMRLADVAETTPDVKERNSLVSLSEDVMRAVDRVDKGKALKVSKQIKEILDRGEEIERATRARAAAQALVQAQNASYGTIYENLSAMKGQEGNAEDVLNLKGVPSSKAQDLRNLAGMRGMAAVNRTVDGLPAALSDAMNVMFLPLWVPTCLIKFVGSAPALLEADIEAVKSDVLGMDTFYVTAMERSPFAALYKGNMRGKSSEEVFEAVTAKLESIPGLRDRVQLFLMGDPTPLTPEQAVDMEDKPLDPVFMLISKEAKPGQSNILGIGATMITFLGTTFTTFAYGIGNFALRPEFYEKINEGDVAVAGLAIPIMMGLLALQAAHEFGHYAMAGNKGIKMGSPIFIPSMQTGLFGAITPMLTFPRNRKDYFDVASAGPLLGTLASLAVFIFGIMMTGSATPEALNMFPLVPAGLFHSSLLVGIMTSIGLPNVMGLAAGATVPVHPLAVVGVTGMIVNALNLMPIGSLDGGRIAMSAFGRKAGGVLGTFTLLLQAISSVFNNYSLQLFWGLLVILFQRSQDLPAKDELTEVGDGRIVTTGILLLFSLLTLVPFPELSQLL